MSVDQPLSGPFTIVDNVVELSSKAATGVTFDRGTGVELNNNIIGSADFFITIPASEYTNLTFKVFGTDRYEMQDLMYSYTCNGKIKVSANSFYTSEQTITLLDHDYLCFTAEEHGGVTIQKPNNSNLNFEYFESDHSYYGWREYTEPIELHKGDRVYFRGDNPQGITQLYLFYLFPALVFGVR